MLGSVLDRLVADLDELKSEMRELKSGTPRTRSTEKIPISSDEHPLVRPGIMSEEVTQTPRARASSDDTHQQVATSVSNSQHLSRSNYQFSQPPYPEIRQVSPTTHRPQLKMATEPQQRRTGLSVSDLCEDRPAQRLGIQSGEGKAPPPEKSIAGRSVGRVDAVRPCK
jgi:hypothetical protein